VGFASGLSKSSGSTPNRRFICSEKNKKSIPTFMVFQIVRAFIGPITF
jgi:hypothetical protein